MDTIAQAAHSFFEGEGWPVAPGTEPDDLTMSFRGENGEWGCYLRIREDDGQLAFYSLLPARCPPEVRTAMALLLTRANHGLLAATFELDLDDGEVRCRSALDVEGDRASEALVRQVVVQNVLTADRYLPAVRAVADDGATPEAALAMVE